MLHNKAEESFYSLHDALSVTSGIVTPGNHLHWYWQQKSTAKKIKQSNAENLN